MCVLAFGSGRKALAWFLPKNRCYLGRDIRLIGSGRQVLPFSSRFPRASICFATAYEVARQVCDRRVARGETIVGRKIGFTNSDVQKAFGISAPTCNFMFDTTLSVLSETDGTFSVGHLSEPLIEPEITATHLARTPTPGMSGAELVRCVGLGSHTASRSSFRFFRSGV